MPSTPLPAVDVRFTNIIYAVQGKKHWLTRKPSESTTILHSVSGRVRAGESLAILGPSGSGKTSLLNVLAARTEHPPVRGEILFGGRPRVARTKRHVGYVMQDDVFFSKLSVRETLEFTANIRLPNLGAEDKKRKVDDVMRRLRLTKCQNTKIGDQQFDKGISGGERKRVNIANELLHNPSLLLADECTSGLDSSSAFTVINLLRELCQEGRTVIATIHQPSSQMFSLFDKILLLAAGRVAYFGPPHKVVPFFEGIGFPFPASYYNPADYMLELVIDDRPKDDDPDAPSVQKRILDAWEEDGLERVGEEGLAIQHRGSLAVESSSPDHVTLVLDGQGREGNDDQTDSAGTEQTSNDQLTLDPESDETPRKPVNFELANDPSPPTSILGRVIRACRKRLRDVTGGHGKSGEPDKYPTNWFSQVYVLGRRSLRQKRGALLDPVHIGQVLSVTVVACLCWFRIEPREGTIEDRLGALSFTNVFWAFLSTFNALSAFPAEKQVLNKDRAGGSYRLSAYYFAKSMIETPADMIYPAFFGVVVYFTIGLNPSFGAFILFLVILVLNVLTAQSVGLLISAVMMDIRQAQIFGAIWILTSMLVSGYYIDPENTPSFVSPLRAISFIRYSYEALVRVEMLGDRTFKCASGPDEVSTIYSNNGDPNFCPIDSDALLNGAQLTNSLSIPAAIIVLMAFIVVTRTMGYFALKLLHTTHKPRRSSWKQRAD